MKRSVKLGSVAGITIGAHWSVLVILTLIADILAVSVLPAAAPGHAYALYWVVAVITALLFLASLLAHELAHAVVARRNHVPVGAITLWMLGGMAELPGDPPSPKAELRVAVAGPLASLAAAVIFLLAGIGGVALGATLIGSPLIWLGVMNAFLAVFNALPGAPLDGGRILRALLWKRYGSRERAGRAAARAGRILGYVIVAVGVAELFSGQYAGLWPALVGWFIIAAAGAEELTDKMRAAASGLHVSDVMTPDPEYGATWTRVDTFVSEVALLSRQALFPVVDFDGSPVALVTLDMLARVPPGEGDTRLDAIAMPLPREYIAGPSDPAPALFERRPLAGELVAVVVADGRVHGMVTAEDLRRLLRQSSLRHPRPAHPEPV
jgi:Zn-dependent protease